MRVLLAHNYYRFRGGEDLCFEADRELLESRGHHVITYTRHNDDVGKSSSWQEAKRTVWNRRTYEEVSELIRRETPDVMHAHNTFPLISPAIYDAAADAGVAVVQALHNYRPMCVGGVLLRDGQRCESCVGKRWATAGIRHRCYRGSLAASAVAAGLNLANWRRRVWTERVDRFIVFSRASRESYLAGGFPEERLELNPHFVELSQSPSERWDQAFFFVGRLSPEKGVACLLEAWKSFPGSWKLRVVGEGPLESDVAAAAQRDSRIEFLRTIPREQMLETMARSAAVIFPSICAETFGRVPIEAYAVGVPVLASRLGGPLDIVEPSRNGDFFEPNSPVSLSQTLERFSAMPEDVVSGLRREARKTYLSRYTAEHNYQRLQQIYERARNERARQPRRRRAFS